MFDFFVEQILGMQWLNDLVWYVLINYFHADQNSNWWSSIHFFFYNTIKGTILALMMAITALSLPSLIMLSQVLQRKLLFLFIGIVSIGIIFVGYIFNFVF